MAIDKRIIIRLENQTVVLQRIDQYGEQFKKDMQRIVTSSSNRVRDRARNGAPIHTGNLHNSIRVKDVSRLLRGTSDRLSKTVTARGSKGNHLHLVELGTRERFNRRGRRFGRMTANPFMARAEAAEAGSFQAAVRERVTRRVEV